MKCKVFTTPNCIKCKGMKEYLKSVEIEKEFIDATSPEGMEQAKTFNVMSVPLVVFFDNNEDQVGIAHDIDELEEILDL